MALQKRLWLQIRVSGSLQCIYACFTPLFFFILTFQLCACGGLLVATGVMGTLLIQIHQYEEFLTPQTAENIETGNIAFILPVMSLMIINRTSGHIGNVNSSFVVIFSELSLQLKRNLKKMYHGFNKNIKLDNRFSTVIIRNVV